MTLIKLSNSSHNVPMDLDTTKEFNERFVKMFDGDGLIYGRHEVWKPYVSPDEKYERIDRTKYTLKKRLWVPNGCFVKNGLLRVSPAVIYKKNANLKPKKQITKDPEQEFVVKGNQLQKIAANEVNKLFEEQHRLLDDRFRKDLAEQNLDLHVKNFINTIDDSNPEYQRTKFQVLLDKLYEIATKGKGDKEAIKIFIEHTKGKPTQTSNSRSENINKTISVSVFGKEDRLSKALSTQNETKVDYEA